MCSERNSVFIFANVRRAFGTRLVAVDYVGYFSVTSTNRSQELLDAYCRTLFLDLAIDKEPGWSEGRWKAAAKTQGAPTFQHGGAYFLAKGRVLSLIAIVVVCIRVARREAPDSLMRTFANNLFSFAVV